MDDTLLLSRLQFALNISFHILFPTISLGLGWLLVFFKMRYSRTKDEKWIKLYFFWVKIFALTFALGVASGITMPFQFSTNWPGFLEMAGNIAGPILAYEVLLAFFLEGTFLGIVLFAYRKVPAWFHTLSTFLVAFGATLSGFIILSLVSWMITPQGFEVRDGIVHVTSWYDVIMSPSMIYRFLHMMIAASLTSAFLLAGISAYRWLRSDRAPDVMSGLRTGIYTALACSLMQWVVGDMHGYNTSQHQPQTMAAAEAIWKTEKGAPLLLFAIPDAETKSNKFEIGIPKMCSLLMTHHLNGEVKGLDQFPEHPSVAPVFFSFRIMVFTGLAMLVVSIAGTWVLKRRKDITPFWAKVFVWMTFSGWVGTLTGWYTTEMGRQPYIIHGVLKTADAATKTGSGMVASTFACYIAGYVILLAAFLYAIYYLARKATQTNTIQPLD